MIISQVNIPLPNLVSEVLTDGDFGSKDISTSGTMTLSDLSTEGVVINSAAGVLSSYDVDLDDLVLKADYAFGANNFTGSGGFSGGSIIGTTGEFGGETDYSEFESDGTLKFNGAATVWDDYVTPLTKATFGGASNDPTLTKLFDDGSGSAGVWGLVFSNGDEVLVTIQMPHKWKLESTIYPHIHFMCMSDVDPSDNFGIEFEYTWADINEDFPANTTLVTTDIPTGVDTDNMHKVANVTASGISGTGHSLSSVLLCRIKRVAASSDDYAGGVAILDFDIHYEIDTVGSRQEYTK